MCRQVLWRNPARETPVKPRPPPPPGEDPEPRRRIEGNRGLGTLQCEWKPSIRRYLSSSFPPPNDPGIVFFMAGVLAAKQLTCIDLFCGGGGFSLGLQRAGFSVLAALDFNQEAIAVFRKNFPAVKHALQADLTQFRPSDLAKLIGTGPVDLIVGGRVFDRATSTTSDKSRPACWYGPAIKTYCSILARRPRRRGTRTRSPFIRSRRRNSMRWARKWASDSRGAFDESLLEHSLQRRIWNVLSAASDHRLRERIVQ